MLFRSGDELIATWKLADGLADARCVRACFAALARLEREAPAYQREIGAVVTFRAGLHLPHWFRALRAVRRALEAKGLDANAMLQGLDAA